MRIYPLLAWLIPALNLYAANTGLFPLSELLAPIAVSLILAITAQLLLRRIAHDKDAGAVATVLLGLMLFSFGLASEACRLLLNQAGLNIDPGTLNQVLALPYLVAAITACVVIRCKPVLPELSAGRMAALTLALIAVPLVQAIKSTPPQTALHDATPAPPSKAITRQQTALLPNIYHIVADGYPSNDYLNKLYAYDNSAFVESLQNLGFIIGTHVHAQYSQTLLSMLAMLDMQKPEDKSSHDTVQQDSWFSRRLGNLRARKYRQQLSTELQNNHLKSTLAEFGYNWISIAVDYEPVRIRSQATYLSPEKISLSYLDDALLEKMPFLSLIQLLGLYPEDRSANRAALEYSFSQGAFNAMQEIPTPHFVYQHVVAPHPPFNVDAKGTPLAIDKNVGHGLPDANHFTHGDPEREQLYARGYAQKLQYLNHKLLQQIKRIQQTETSPYLILIHGDHGGGLYWNHDHYDSRCPADRYHPFFAIFDSQQLLQQGDFNNTSLTDIYPSIFSRIFGTSIERSADISYFTSWKHPQRHIPLSQQQRHSCDVHREPAMAK